MKNLIKYCLAAFAIFFISSCKKDSSDNSLTGKWKQTEYYISIGGPGSWKAVDKKSNNYIQINIDGTLAGNSYLDYKTYIIKNSTIITFYKADGTYEDFYYTITNKGLTLSPAGPVVCIEGCSDRYIKIK
jgi:hypothetical protein